MAPGLAIYVVRVGCRPVAATPWKREFHTRGPLHVPGHALIFAVSAFVACRSAQSVSQRVVRCAAVIGFGGALEMLQSWIFRSRFEWDDVLTDACGVLLALVFVTCADSMRKNRHSLPEQDVELVTEAPEQPPRVGRIEASALAAPDRP